MLKQYVLLAAAAMGLSGCASVPMGDPNKDAALKTFGGKLGIAGIYIYRVLFFGFRASISSLFGLAFLIAGASLSAASAQTSKVAMVKSSRLVYVPLIFSSGQTVRTTACLQVTERVYAEPAWWERFNGQANTPEYAFTAMISATKRKDKAALFELTEATQRGDANRFNQDAEQFFRWPTYEPGAVPRAYEFGNLAVFPVQIKPGGQLVFLFARQDDGHYAFLPYGSEQLDYVIVRDWLNSKWGPATIGGPEYCTDENIKRATHRISLSNSLGVKRASPPSYLYFTGASLAKPVAKSKVAKQVLSTIEEMKSELKSPDKRELGAFIRHLTPEGGRGMKEWFASASQPELDNYKTAITEQEPFFLIDALPLAVVYAKSPGSSQAMFFISNANNELLWTRSTVITDSTRIFAGGPLRGGASEARPFASSLIK